MASGQVRSGVQHGVRVVVQVPATSANLGPGFDSLGLALGVHDLIAVEATGSGLEVVVDGEGAAKLVLDESHLVVRAIRAGLEWAGAGQPGLRLRCRNAIPHGRGLGSSAAAVVGGLVAARSLLGDPSRLDNDAVLAIATAFEGHPDNAAAALLGGLTISWMDERTAESPAAESIDADQDEPRAGAPAAHAVRLEVFADLVAVLCVPEGELATSRARAMLPAYVPHRDAAFNAGRAALLVEAITRRPELLPAATHDRLHQEQRSAAMPQTAALMHAVRAQGLAAVVSGAGPSVLVLGTGDGLERGVQDALARSGSPGGWRLVCPGINTQGTRLITDGI